MYPSVMTVLWRLAQRDNIVPPGMLPEAERLELDPDKYDFSLVTPFALLAIVELKGSANPDSLRCPAQAKTTQRNGLIQELQLGTLAAFAADAGGKLPGPGAIEPKPDQGPNE